MRSVLTDGALPLAHLGWATGLNLVYLSLMIAWFYHTFAVCKEQGLLVRIGE